MSFDEVINIFIKDLGHQPEYFFREFDKIPLASASLAQVHHAVTHDGREVAVKVQFPYLRDQFKGDMFIHYLILHVAPLVFPGFELEWMHEEVASNLFKELDFENRS